MALEPVADLVFDETFEWAFSDVSNRAELAAAIPPPGEVHPAPLPGVEGDEGS